MAHIRRGIPSQPARHSTALESTGPVAFVTYLMRGLREGFRIGPRGLSGGHQAKRNLRSAYDHAEVIDGYLAREVQLGRVQRLPPPVALSFPMLRISPFGVIPKRNRPGKWRLIVDPHYQRGIASTTNSTRCCARFSTPPLTMRSKSSTASGQEPCWLSLTCERHTGWYQFTRRTVGMQ